VGVVNLGSLHRRGLCFEGERGIVLKFTCPKCHVNELVESEVGYYCWKCGYHRKQVSYAFPRPSSPQWRVSSDSHGIEPVFSLQYGEKEDE